MTTFLENFENIYLTNLSSSKSVTSDISVSVFPSS